LKLGNKVQIIEADMKERNKETHALEAIKQEANLANENSRETQKSLFNELNEIQYFHEDINRLSD